MKKRLLALALAFAFSVAGTAFAANPFVDVPAKHWSYDAVSKLAADGIVDGYGDGTFKGDKTITRYEMATIVAKALAKEDKANAEQKALIEKLAAEYSAELDNLGVRVGALEKKAAADSVNITGEARLRYNNWDEVADPAADRNSLKLRTRLHVNGKINDEWSYYGRLQAENRLNGNGGEDSVTMDNVYVQGPIGGATLTAGKFDYFKGYGLMIDSTLNGANLAFGGDKVKANVFYGKDNNDDIWSSYGTVNRLQVMGADVTYALSDKSNINAGYYQFKDNKGSDYVETDFGDDSVKVWEAGFDTKLGKNFGLQASYGQSDANDDDTAWFTQVSYKGASAKNVGSFGAWVNYRHLEQYAAPKTTFDGAYAFNDQANGAKGFEVGFGYAPIENALWKVQYVNLKPTTDGAGSEKSKFFQTQVEFFF
ncbi:putative secreted protein [Propionispora sp. 2/2-37]|uniref:S-layer homology domain-containing protein n=1 Tax=Propionispora sp. 2/2-37 TaxID=1677858 RepID=UPI0006BB563F|nr:S-layer homology domain-containing protein [Propionispora sp. 2/2-37]CUH94516.1 putative secreted protein [Propionispora sp. 2/2-37]